MTVVLAVAAADVADALAIAWDAFTAAAGDDLTGWEIPAAAAQVQPEPPDRYHRDGDSSAIRRPDSPSLTAICIVTQL